MFNLSSKTSPAFWESLPSLIWVRFWSNLSFEMRWREGREQELCGWLQLRIAFSYHQLNWRIQAVPACCEQQSVRGARFLSLLLPPTSISSVPVSALPHASNLCTWTAFLNSSVWVLAEWKPDGPAVPTVISPPALASLPFSLLSWHGRNICLYLGGLGLTAVPLSLCCNMSWKLFIPLLLRLVEVSARWIWLLRKQLTFQDEFS